MNFDEAPILVFRETTRACELACRHCRAEAMHEPAPDELTTSEGCRLIEQLAGFGPRPPVLILSGGDVMRRSDLVELVGAARRVGLPVALAPSVTSRL
jgi:MoaA/NifB/PqqE/SkfB family radical SAM enzyme